MIDWVTCRIRWPHPPLATGQVVSLSRDGEEEWRTVKRLPVVGSHSAVISVRSTGSAAEGMAEYLSISGNPSKFLQGHNLFGSDDLLTLVYDTVRLIADRLELDIDVFTWSRIRAGEYDVSMVDINYSFTLANQADVMSWIHAAEFKSRSRFGRPVTHPGTIYWNKHSTLWAIKVYSKYNEIVRGPKDQRLPETLPMQDQLIHWSENILRIELRLLKELRKLKLTRAIDLAKHVRELFNSYQERILMNEQRRITPEQLLSLPTKLRATYTLWAEGHHMVSMLSKATFYRHRKELLEHGVDISIACDFAAETSNVVPFVRVLEAKPAQIPDWAFHHGLVHPTAANF